MQSSRSLSRGLIVAMAAALVLVAACPRRSQAQPARAFDTNNDGIVELTIFDSDGDGVFEWPPGAMSLPERRCNGSW